MKLFKSEYCLRLVGAAALAAVLSLSGCGGGGGSSPDGDTQVTAYSITSFGPAKDGNSVSIGAAATDASLEQDLPITDTAHLKLEDKTIKITDGKGVRAYEITLLFGDDVINFSFENGDFIGADPAGDSGTLATLRWDGDTRVTIKSATLTDAAGDTIPVIVE